MAKPIPTLDDYVQAHLTAMQAPLRRATVFGPAGRWVQRRTGERIMLAPDGTPVRVVSFIDGGSAVEHGNDTGLRARCLGALISRVPWRPDQQSALAP